MIRTEDEARERLRPYAARLRKCVIDAVSGYHIGPKYADSRANHTKRTAANSVNDDAWANLRKEFEGEQGFSFSEGLGRRLLHFEGQFNIRVKKLDKNFRPRNIATQGVLDFLQQVVAPHLPGMDPPTNVDLCYRLVGLAEIQPNVYLRCPKGRSYHWLWELEEPVAAAAGPAAIPAPKPGPSVTERRVRPRKPASEEKPGEEPANDAPRA